MTDSSFCQLASNHSSVKHFSLCRTFIIHQSFYFCMDKARFYIKNWYFFHQSVTEARSALLYFSNWNLQRTIKSHIGRNVFLCVLCYLGLVERKRFHWAVGIKMDFYRQQLINNFVTHGNVEKHPHTLKPPPNDHMGGENLIICASPHASFPSSAAVLTT